MIPTSTHRGIYVPPNLPPPDLEPIEFEPDRAPAVIVWLLAAIVNAAAFACGFWLRGFL